MKKVKSLFIIGFLLLVVLPVRPVRGLEAAEPGSLETAIAWGLEHSPSLLKLREEVEQLQRELSIIEAGLRWQLSLDGGLDLTGSEGTAGSAPGRTGTEQVRAGITGRKVFRSGLALEPELTLKKEIDTAAEPEIGFTISLNQRLYPWVPTTEEQRYLRTLNSLQKAEANLTWQATRMKIEWLEGYLNLLRLAEQLAIAETEYNLAADELRFTRERAGIGEAGPAQLLAAEIALKQAEYKRKQTANRFNEAERQWRLALGLPADYQIELAEDNRYLQQLRAEVQAQPVTTQDHGAYLAQLEAGHYQLIVQRLDRAQLEKDWLWKQAEYRPQVSSGGTYDPSDQSWTFNLKLNYRLWDGGIRRLEREKYEAQLAAAEREEQNLRAQLDAELRSLLSEVALAELLVEERELALAKARLETEAYRQQREAGYLTEKDWTLKLLEEKNAELGYKTAVDQVFLGKLRLFHLVGMF